jgi:hypothetical protein
VIGAAIVLVFLALNYSAYDGFFQDDELDNLSWAPSMSVREFALALIKPTFDVSNFRPPGHLYFSLMGKVFGLDFPPYMTPILVLHLLNVLLLFLLLRKLRIGPYCALAGVAFFALSAAAMDAYWKPMYVFDLLCTTFSLASILAWMYRRWILSFVAFWIAYKSKELAVMLPAVLLAYEYWLGERRFIPLIPFFAASLSFGLQGVLLNPNKDNEYTFRFTLQALRITIPFYSQRLFAIPLGGCALLLLAFFPDRRIWFGLALMSLFLFTLLFLPGRLYEAYAYLPLVGAVIAMSAAASRFHPAWAWVALAIWMPLNYHRLRHEQRAKLAADDEAYVFVDSLQRWTSQHPQIRTLVYTSVPRVYHDWGVTAAWNIAHNTLGLPALYRDSPQAVKALHDDTVAYATWDSATRTLLIQIHSPG